jgi:hypothetical protein
MLYIICFGPYRSYSFLFSNASPSLNLTLQNTFNRSAINTIYKILTLNARFCCRISHALLSLLVQIYGYGFSSSFPTFYSSVIPCKFLHTLSLYRSSSLESSHCFMQSFS